MENFPDKENRQSRNLKFTRRQKVKSKSTSALPPKSKKSVTVVKKEKKENYRIISKTSLLKDFKNTAITGLNNVKHGFNSLSTLLKPSKKSKNEMESYQQITNIPTPIKLYSPFGIETPTTNNANINQENRLKLRQQLFNSPGFKNEIENLGSGIQELNILSERIQKRQTKSAADIDFLF